MYSYSISTVEFHTLCILQQTLRCREYFCLMRPLIRSCGFTSNRLTFKIPPHIRTLMRTTVHLTLVLKISIHFTFCHTAHCHLSPWRWSPSSHMVETARLPILNIRDWNSSSWKGHLDSIYVPVLPPFLYLNLWLSNFPIFQPLETRNLTYLLLLTLLKSTCSLISGLVVEIILPTDTVFWVKCQRVNHPSSLKFAYSEAKTSQINSSDSLSWLFTWTCVLLLPRFLT